MKSMREIEEKYNVWVKAYKWHKKYEMSNSQEDDLSHIIQLAWVLDRDWKEDIK